ncbi:phage tail assembly chaperone [Oceanobacillus sp. CF4.6]|uniref:phage tail assembly chaperone n=1 Tax=Oceanobacillus sp. CF4.6 TaxID=3373080 RepID=UPI003EE464A9
MTNENKDQKESVEESMDLSFFMPDKVEVTEIVEAPISKRFKDKNGKIIPFKFKTITTERVDELEKLHTLPVIKKNKKVGERVDQAQFIAHIAIDSTIYPNFKAQEMRKAYKSEDPIEIAKKVLNVAGEYSNWIAKASEVNGFDDSVEDLEEAAKN